MYNSNIQHHILHDILRSGPIMMYMHSVFTRTSIISTECQSRYVDHLQYLYNERGTWSTNMNYNLITIITTGKTFYRCIRNILYTQEQTGYV